MRPWTWLTILLVLLPCGSQAQDAGGAGKNRPKVRFDPAQVVTMTGTVLGEYRTVQGNGVKTVRIGLKVGQEQVAVHLGPETWLDSQKLKLQKGDEVTVKGSRFTYGESQGLIAQTITRAGDTLILRDARGVPAWANKEQKP